MPCKATLPNGGEIGTNQCSMVDILNWIRFAEAFVQVGHKGRWRARRDLCPGALLTTGQSDACPCLECCAQY